MKNILRVVTILVFAISAGLISASAQTPQTHDEFVQAEKKRRSKKITARPPIGIQKRWPCVRIITTFFTLVRAHTF